MILKILWNFIKNVLKAEKYSFLVNDTTLKSDSPLRFRKNLLEWIYNKIIAIDNQIKDEKIQFDNNRETVKISDLSSGKIDKYVYLTGEEILPSNQKQIKQPKFTYSALEKAFEEQTKTVKVQGDEQVKGIKEHGKQLIKFNKDVDNESHKMFDELSYERMSKIKDLTDKLTIII